MTDTPEGEQRDESAGAVRPAGPPPGAPARRTPLPAEQLVRNLAAVTAVFYVVGFLTTNAYLYQLGVSDFSLLRTRFVLTGVLTLAPLALALITGVYVALDATVYVGDLWRIKRAHLAVLVDVAIPFALYFLLFSYVAGNEPVVAARDAALLTVICAVIVLALIATLTLYRRSERKPLRRIIYRGDRVEYERFTERFGVPDAVVETLIFILGGILLILTYLGIFGVHFYPIIPEQLGGGRPRTAQLLVTANAIPAARELGIDVTEGAPLSGPVQLLWEGEDTLVIRLPAPHQRSVVQLDRGLIDGVVTGAVLTPHEPSD